MDTIRQTKLIVNTKHIEHNIRELQKYVGDNVKVMPVIKARGYGTGIGTQVDLFNNLGIDILAVAVVDERYSIKRKRI
jgi:alanine racemase